MTTFDDRVMRAYLLGQAAPQEAEPRGERFRELEERFLEDEDFAAALCAAEDDLFDAFARGLLSDAERRQFVARYGAERPRLIVAHALAARTGGAQGAANRARRWIPASAAAAATIAAVTLGYWLRDPPSEPARTDGGRPEAPATPGPARPSAAPVTLAIALGTSRSTSAVPEVTLPDGTPALVLRVRLNPADKYDGYAMALRSGSNAVVWREERIRATAEGGDLMIAGTIASNLLPAGSYELSVTGLNGGNAEDLGFATVRIRR